MNLCTCGSGVLDAECCLPIIDGSRIAETATETMRARYTAYTRGDIDYIIESNHPDTRDDINREDVERWSSDSDWLGLTIVSDVPDPGSEDDAWVTFRVRYKLDGHTHLHRERSLFRKLDGIWKFHTATEDVDEFQPALVPVVAASTVGRNDPCHCGSGKKFKKCHGA